MRKALNYTKKMKIVLNRNEFCNICGRIFVGESSTRRQLKLKKRNYEH